MSIQQEGHLEWELEDEFEGSGEFGSLHEFEDELSHETSHEFEDEFSHEFSHEFEDELSHELEDEDEWGDIPGGVVKGIGGLFGETEDEFSHEFSHEYSHELEGEEFLGKLVRGVGKFVKQNAPMLKSIAKVAAPLIGTAIGGPAVGQLLGKATNLLGETEFEDEFETEDEFEAEYGGHEISPMHAALAEYMASAASQSASEMESEAMMRAATTTIILSRADRRALLSLVPQLTRAASILNRLLRRRRLRPISRAIPKIMDDTVKTLVRGAKMGKAITPKAAARVMAAKTKKVLSNPNVCTRAIVKNVQRAKQYKRVAKQSRTARPRTRRPGARV